MMLRNISQTNDNNIDSHILYHGGRLGFFAAIYGSFLFLCFYIFLLWITAAFTGVGIVSETMLSDRQGYLVFFFIVYWIIGFLITFLVSIIPVIIAGLVNAWLLKNLAQSFSLTSFRGVIVGILVGGIFSIVPIFIGLMILTSFVFNAPSLKAQSQIIIEVIISGLLAATFIGGWHGWKMTRHLS